MASLSSFIENLYDKHSGKLIFIPIILLILSLLLLFYNQSTTGEFLKRDVTLKGGISISFLTSKDVDLQTLKNSLRANFPDADFIIREFSPNTLDKKGFLVDTSDVDKDTLINFLTSNFDAQIVSVNFVGPTLGEYFFQDAIKSLLLAFFLMALVVFIYFRNIGPSFIVIFSIISDLVMTLAMMSIFGIRLSTNTIAALLMLIGYSVDTDILLSTRMLRLREFNLAKRIVESLKTGLTMTLTTFTVVLLAYFISVSEVIRQIMAVLAIGLFIDIINTYLQNATFLKLLLERKNGQKR